MTLRKPSNYEQAKGIQCPEGRVKMKTQMYDTFDKIRELTKLVKTRDDEHKLDYLKMVQTGSLSLPDYGVGFLCFHTFTSFQVETNMWNARILIATIDDGDYGGWSKPLSQKAAMLLVHKIATDIMRDMTVFPTDEELNTLLRPYGVFVGPE